MFFFSFSLLASGHPDEDAEVIPGKKSDHNLFCMRIIRANTTKSHINEKEPKIILVEFTHSLF